MTEEFGMDELMAQSVESAPGAVVEGTVVGQSDAYLLVNVGLKQEAALPIKELGANLPAMGSQIPVLILRMSGPEGRPLVSWKQAREKKNWDKVAQSFQNKETIQAKIIQKVKGGFQVDIGLDAFMPASQVDEKQISNPNDWVGKTVPVQILEMDLSKSNVLVSRRKVMEQERLVKRTQTLASLQVGNTAKGRVTGLTSFGAFVDIGGIEGLLHVSDLSWTHVEKPQDVLKVGDEIDVKILKYDPASNRISLGRKQLLTHPWEGLSSRHPVGSLVKGKVVSLADFGAFVEIEPGVEGLIHVSELSWIERLKHPQALLKVGQVVDARVMEIDRDREKMSLSLRRVGPSPWEEAAKSYPLGARVQGEISHLASFGAFVKLPGGIEALIKTQDISWTDRIQSPHNVFKVGDKVTAVVLELNPQQEKLSLGIKQLSSDPLKALKIGQEVKGKVAKIVDFGIFVKLDSGVEGLVRSEELQLQKSMFSEKFGPGMEREDPKLAYKEGDEITTSIIKINKKDRKIELSVRRYEKNQERQLLRKYSGTQAKLTLGETTGWQDDGTTSS